MSKIEENGYWLDDKCYIQFIEELKPKWSHFCYEWDGLLIDENCDEIVCCNCFDEKDPDYQAFIEAKEKRNRIMGNHEIENVNEEKFVENIADELLRLEEENEELKEKLAEVKDEWYDTQDMVDEFCGTFGLYDMPHEKAVKHAVRCLKEETRELVHAIEWAEDEGHLVDQMHKVVTDEHIAKIVKELCDVQYVLDQAMLLLGVDHYFYDAFQEVHRSNMSKVDHNGKPVFDKHGKVQKTEHYKPADILRIIKHHHHG